MVADVRDRSKLAYLSLILHVPVSELEQKFGWSKSSENPKNRSRWIELAHGVDESVEVAASKLAIKGLYSNRRYARYYPCGKDAAHVIGFLNKEDSPVMGIERTLDFYLSGSAGWRVREVNGSRKEIRQFRIRDVEPQHGYHVVLTLDAQIQRIVEEEIERVHQTLAPESVSMVVTQSSTGAVLAMASRPTFDPNAFWEADFENDLRNRVVSDLIEPGSTFKIVTTSAFLNEGLGNLESRFDCSTSSVMHRNRKVRLPSDTHPRKELALHEVIQKSSNRGTALVGMQLGENKLFEYACAFGFGQRTGVELNGEAKGILHPLDRWDHYTLSRVAIGYSVGVTPLQVHNAMSVIANEGRWVAPFLVEKVLDARMQSVLDFEKASDRQVIAPKTAESVKQCLIEAVSLEGTGSRARLKNIQVAGKTGTSRKLVAEGYLEDRHIGSFSGFFPADAPEYTITVVVNDPRQAKSTYGGSVAAPSFRTIAEKIVALKGLPTQAGKDLMAQAF
jgi:cell division protein FtsI/penicillin-binding protein 2